ncbi:GIY-YIG nuclease family protein [Patescibacteria group bacterium]|nr:GIY-YIG nuclease family protein [Patescibacteria group bacterium]
MYYIYIVSSESGTLYIGMTNDLKRRIFEHREKLIDGFTKKYDCKKLIYFEETSDVYSAIAREKQLKNWNRGKKEHLIYGFNPEWKDLFDSL